MKLSSTWRSPSNIALVKYWGKYELQIPANPSLSFTLSSCYSQTQVTLSAKQSEEEFDFELLLDGKPQPDFKLKITKFLGHIAGEAPFLKDYHLQIETSNSFPHSSGIASSASGMSALALCLLSLKEKTEGQDESHFYQKASEWARLGSGSASRSVYGPMALWGRFSEVAGAHDYYAIPFGENLHPLFQDFCDYILIIEKGAKSVSSTAGHKLMQNHPYAQRRFLQAHENLSLLTKALQTGHLEDFGMIVESEALTLHAMMMTSNPSYILMKPHTLSVIEAIRNFRQQTSLPVYFTLDAGANVHLLFPTDKKTEVEIFVKNEIKPYLQEGAYLKDQIGKGPEKL